MKPYRIVATQLRITPTACTTRRWSCVATSALPPARLVTAVMEPCHRERDLSPTCARPVTCCRPQFLMRVRIRPFLRGLRDLPIPVTGSSIRTTTSWAWRLDLRAGTVTRPTTRVGRWPKPFTIAFTNLKCGLPMPHVARKGGTIGDGRAEAQVVLGQANDALTKARVRVHTARLAKVNAELDAGLKTSGGRAFRGRGGDEGARFSQESSAGAGTRHSSSGVCAGLLQSGNSSDRKQRIKSRASRPTESWQPDRSAG